MADEEILADIIRSSTKRSIGTSTGIGLMFSGGLDSAILAVIARKYCDITLYTAGMEGSHDLEWGTQCAGIIDLPHVKIVLREDDIVRSMENVVRVHGMTNPKWMSTFVAFDLVLQKVSKEKVMCGQGADELFGGYRKYGRMEDSASVMSRDVRELLDRELPAYNRMAEHYGIILISPYLDDEVIAFSNTIAISNKFNKMENKIILRKAAELLGVPGMMAKKQKKAMQYGTDISKIIKKHLKNSGINLEKFIYINEI